MVKFILIITSFSLALLINFSAYSQAITSSGETSITENFVITSSVGETFNTIAEGATEGFLVGASLSIEEITDVKSLRTFKASVYPNPTINFINLEIEEFQEGVEIQLVDMSGKNNILKTKFNEDGKCQIPVQNLSSGMYFIKILDKNTPDNPQIFKIIKK